VASTEISVSRPVRVLLLVVMLFLAAFLLIFGISNLLHPLVAASYRSQNTIVCLGVSFLGLVLIFLAIRFARRSTSVRG
jgi:hypothetical protein